MTPAVALSPAFIQSAIVREAPRPPELRNHLYAERFDWQTLFYDVYRCGRHVVLQGPPLFNLLDELRQCEPFASALRGLFPKAVHYGMKKRGEIWLKSDAQRIVFDGPLGHFDLAVQPSDHARYAGKRVLLTLSKDNEIRWILDWARFHQRLHGAQSLLFYDNASQAYSYEELQARLQEGLPEMDVQVVSWPFLYGPQAGPNWAVNGFEPDWDSDYCQVGVLQHARFRFLQQARSVMHNDVDELVIGQSGASVFEAAERSRQGMVKFDGRWISVAGENPIDPARCRHADFVFDEGTHVENCPPKWCQRPQAFGPKVSWGVHNVFGARGNQTIASDFLFRHFRGVTTNWNYTRWTDDVLDRSRLVRDEALAAEIARAGIGHIHA
jgi:hypothetical protein